MHDETHTIFHMVPCKPGNNVFIQIQAFTKHYAEDWPAFTINLGAQAATPLKLGEQTI